MVVFMFVIFATALLLRMLSSCLVVAFMPYWSFFGSLQFSMVTSLLCSMMPRGLAGAELFFSAGGKVLLGLWFL
jgi:hypothetical protein